MTSRRRTGAGERGPVAAAASRVLWLLRLAVTWEVTVWRSLARWVARRPAGAGAGVRTFGYARSVTPIFWLFILMSAIEVPVAHVLLPWQWAQVLSLALGVWGLFWMLGLLAAQHVHPHLVDDRGLRLRSGGHVDVVLPWSAVRSLRTHRRDLPSSRAVQLTDSVLSLPSSSETRVDVRLVEPTEVRLPKGSALVTEVRVHVDDPAAFVAAVRAHLPEGAPRP